MTKAVQHLPKSSGRFLFPWEGGLKGRMKGAFRPRPRHPLSAGEGSRQPLAPRRWFFCPGRPPSRAVASKDESQVRQGFGPVDVRSSAAVRQMFGWPAM